MEDNKIIELLFDRNEQAIKELSNSFGRLCSKIAYNILGNRLDAEECVNDTYLGVWNSVPPKCPNPLISYVCRIARNIATAKYHSNKAAKRNSNYDVALDELEGCFALKDTVESEFDAKQTAMTIDKFLLSLKSTDRIMFVRRYFCADSIADIASLFDKSNHYVSVRLARIREKLRKQLEKEGVFL